MTVGLMQLVLPALLATALAWIASGVIHMVIKWHNADYNQMPNEDEVVSALRSGELAPGLYNTPYCVDMKDMGSEEMQQRFKEGPVAFVTIFPSGMPPMGKMMVQQILFFLGGALLVAYCATLALQPGAEYMAVFRFFSAAGFLAYGWAVIPYSIWYGHTWGSTCRYLVDALIYALMLAGSFAWLWPAATQVA